MPVPENILAEQPGALGGLDRLLEALDPERELAADEGVADRRADRHAADHDPFEDDVGVALEGAAVLEDVRLALVAVADDIFLVIARSAARTPT